MTAQRFSDFGIKSPSQVFTGDKVKIFRILNREIQVCDYRIEPSKYSEGGKCLYLQIDVEGVKSVVFTGSNHLIQQIEMVPKTGFPFNTTIIQEDQRFEFT
ncbi:hypothetical protein DN752_19530 [Echinicola strongylocentroti]|uniref:Uncharacterized protein n=1 Tax=Echinicola strongylocentroti TaxID=1795355 RepID=A0A2Z4IMU0_9BACT|nr:hypothetical protein [Echinicola strongylocentroti]AWW32154.1 hypothetical protein DN752_19530 [Echinicola strongylocentroti]